jgi:hypothetical protein
VAFNALPTELALATLDKVEAEGPGVKLRRREVYAIADRLDEALERGEPAVTPAAWQPVHGLDIPRAAAAGGR